MSVCRETLFERNFSWDYSVKQKNVSRRELFAGKQLSLNKLRIWIVFAGKHLRKAELISERVFAVKHFS